uniref:Methylated-DNA--protein-cysteine methyltransferase n=1 Tax=Polytomella parva TaxID=51329 RepID=A0A7S0UVQ5_9CHLO|mmetsp:Transcript_18695/g.33929  ORF Transcript_18695/g.33929 Transcript_18695/m.33929 type:complete len:153 (+) Transcript_18695:75-533(+)
MVKAKIVKQRPPTAFESSVYEICSAIPAGKVATYGILSKILKTSPRAVGQSLRRNPYAPIVPCHRVIAADRSIGGFCGQTGCDNTIVQKKIRLLEDEGVAFEIMDLKSVENRQAMVMEKCIISIEELENSAAALLKVSKETIKVDNEKIVRC